MSIPYYKELRDQTENRVRTVHDKKLTEYREAYQEYLNNCSKPTDSQECTEKNERIVTLNNELHAIIAEIQKDNQQVEQATDRITSEYADPASTTGQQSIYVTASNMSQTNTELSDRMQEYVSARQLMKQMQEKYRYQKKIMWIYIILLLALVGGFVYLYMTAHKKFAAEGAPEGAASTGEALKAGVDKMKKKMSEGVEAVSNMFGASEEVGEGEELAPEAEGGVPELEGEEK